VTDSVDNRSAQETVRRAREAEARSPHGRLPLPDYVDWPTYPYEGELRVRPVADVVVPEPPRHGAGGVGCRACSRPDEDYLWVDAEWRVASTEAPTGMPVVLLLEPRKHADLGDLPEELVRAIGPMLWRIERALSTLDGVGRVHINRWGDGAEHLHWWFFVRPYGLVQARGSFLSDWDDVFPPRPREEWQTDLQRVAAVLRSG
jgi:diadenosine tetraphosphate (Ap4A) HIT family hydrolase